MKFALLGTLTVFAAACGNPENTNTSQPQHAESTELRDFSDFTNQLKQQGFAELLPPSTIPAPGTILSVIDTLPLRTKTLCSARSAFGDSLQIDWSPTVSSNIAQTIKGGLTIDADYLKAISGGASGKAQRKLAFSMSEPSIGEISREQIVSNAHRRKAACRDAILDALQNGETVSLVTTVFRATISSTSDVVSNDKLNVKADAGSLKAVTASLGISYGQGEGTAVAGSGLYWGIQGDSRLALLVSPGKYYTTIRGSQVSADTSAMPTFKSGSRVSIER